MATSLTISITQNSQNIANNTSNVTVSAKISWTYGSYNALGQCTGYITIDGTKYSFSGMSFNASHTTSGSETVMTKTVNVSHNSDGTKTISCKAYFDTKISSDPPSASASKVLTKIARKSTVSVPNGILGTKQTFTVTRQSSDLTHTITYKCGSASGTVCTKSSDTTPDWTPPTSLAAQSTTTTSVTVTFTITTYSGNTKVGDTSTDTASYSIPDTEEFRPKCTVAVSDPNGYASTYGGYIEGLSTMYITVTGTPAHGSPISTYAATANGGSSNKSSFTTGYVTMPNSGTTSTISATVTDKRGRSGTSTASVTVIPYDPPKITRLDATRTDGGQGGSIQITISASATNVAGMNHVSYELRYKKTSEASYTLINTGLDGNLSVSGATFTVGADTESSYDVILTVSDNFKSTAMSTTASTAATLMHWKASGKGMGIGKLAEEDDVLDVGYKIRARQGVIDDTPWILLEPSSMFTVYNGNENNTPRYKVSGNVVTICGVLTPTRTFYSGTDGNNLLKMALPPEYCPNMDLVFICQGSGINRWTLTVKSDGGFTESRYGTTEYTSIEPNTWLPFCVTYQI